MVKTCAFVVALLLAGAFLNSRHSPTNAICDRVVDRVVELAKNTQHTATGLASDVKTEVTKKN